MSGQRKETVIQERSFIINCTKHFYHLRFKGRFGLGRLVHGFIMILHGRDRWPQ